MREPTVFCDARLPEQLRGRVVATLSMEERWEIAEIASVLLEPALRSAARRRHRCDQTVQDLVQTCLVRFATGETLGRHLGAVSLEQGFLKMLSSISRAHSRARTRAAEVTLSESLCNARDPEDRLLAKLDADRMLRLASQILEQWWGQLTPTEQKVVDGWWRGLHAAEIACRRGLSVGAVHARLCSSRKKLSTADRKTLDAARAIVELRGEHAPCVVGTHDVAGHRHPRAPRLPDG